MTPQWYFGPAGNLRSLPPPNMNIGNGLHRLGTMHKTLSGRRVSDTFGYLAEYRFNIEWIEQEDYAWFEALYAHMVEPPYYLVDPLRVNMLSRYSAASRFARYHDKGPTPVNAHVDTERIETPVSWCDTALAWFAFQPGDPLVWDRSHPAPVMPGGTVTFSVYFKQKDGGLGITPHLVGAMRDGSETTFTASKTVLPQMAWERVTATFTLPQGVVSVYPSVTPDGSDPSSRADYVYAANPQLEVGSVATPAMPGGAAPHVLFNNMDTTSPRYPYQSIAISLLEV